MRSIVELVAPTVCVACGLSSDGELCSSCARDVRVLTEPLCPRCGAPQRPGTCRCATLGGFTRARSLVAFAEPARALTLRVKRRGSTATAAAMGRLLADLCRRDGFVVDVVTYVPGGRASRRRGFDHVELIAASTGSDLGVPVRGVLRRAREGPRQADVSLGARRDNVRDRFVARRVGGRVLLVDDVFTTGATVEACAGALLTAGACRVDVVTWARTLLRRCS